MGCGRTGLDTERDGDAMAVAEAARPRAAKHLVRQLDREAVIARPTADTLTVVGKALATLRRSVGHREHWVRDSGFTHAYAPSEWKLVAK